MTTLPKPVKAPKPRKRIARSKRPAPYRQRENKGKLRKLADDLMSLYVRHKAGWKCWVCGSMKADEMQMAHIIGKGAHQAGRYVERNVRCCCSRCHVYYTHRPEEWRAYLDKRIGDGAFQALFDMVRVRHHRTDLMLEVLYWDRQLCGRSDLWKIEERHDALRAKARALGVLPDEGGESDGS